MGKIKLDKLDIDLNMIFYDPKKDKWRCIHENCGREFIFQADAMTHLSKDHPIMRSNERGGGGDEMS